MHLPQAVLMRVLNHLAEAFKHEYVPTLLLCAPYAGICSIQVLPQLQQLLHCHLPCRNLLFQLNLSCCVEVTQQLACCLQLPQPASAW